MHLYVTLLVPTRKGQVKNGGAYTSEHFKRLNAKPEPTGVELKDEVVMGIEKFIRTHLVKLDSKS